MKEEAPRLSSLYPVLVGCALWAACPAAAFAQSNPAAEAYFNQGRDLMDAGKTEEACPLFERSQKLESKLGTLLNLALCHEAIGRTASAWVEFADAARMADKRGEQKRGDFALEHKAALSKKLSMLRVSRVEPANVPLADLTITLDGNAFDAGQINAPFPIDPGKHQLLIKASGYAPRTLDFDVPVGPIEHPVQIPDLESTGTPPIIDPPPIKDPPPKDKPRERPHREEPKRGSPALAIGGFVVGGVSLLTGIITGSASIAMESSLESIGGQCGPDDSDDLDTAYALANTSNVTFGIAGVGALIGVIGLFIQPGKPTDASEETVRLVPTGDLGAGVRVSF